MKKLTFNIFIIFSILGCIALGVWQVKRLQWKEGLISQLEKYQDANPEQLDTKNFDQKKELFKPIFTFGAFQHDYEMLISAKFFSEKRDKNELGYHLITPFITIDGDIIFVNRGWVPEEKKLSESRKDSLYRTNIEIPLQGIVRKSTGKAPWFMPANIPEKNIWFWIDIPEMTKKLEGVSDLENIKPILIQQAEATNYNNFKYPIPISADIKLYNQHLNYAITWFLMALAITGMWAYYLRKSS